MEKTLWKSVTHFCCVFLWSIVFNNQFTYAALISASVTSVKLWLSLAKLMMSSVASGYGAAIVPEISKVLHKRNTNETIVFFYDFFPESRQRGVTLSLWIDQSFYMFLMSFMCPFECNFAQTPKQTSSFDVSYFQLLFTNELELSLKVLYYHEAKYC